MSEADLESQNLQNLLKDNTVAKDAPASEFHPVAIVLWVAAYLGLFVSLIISMFGSSALSFAWVVGLANFFALGALGSIINLLKKIAVNTSKQ